MTKSEFTEYIVMRHGQSEADLQHVFEGWLDTPLTKQGLHDAQLAAEWIFANHPPHRIICSPLVRAKRTAEEVARRIGIEIEVNQKLKERNNGELADLTKDEAAQRGFLRHYLPHETAPGGETLIAFRARAESFWSKLMSQSESGQRILIVSHGQMIGMLFRCFLRLPMDDSVQLKTSDTGLHCWRVKGNRRTIVFSNSRIHLGFEVLHEKD